MTDWMTRLGWNRQYLHEYQTEWLSLIYGSVQGISPMAKPALGRLTRPKSPL
jgi:hypothetical protein